jgi:hypothetical protein
MNLTGNVLTLFNVFNSLEVAAAECDYATSAQRIGTLIKSLTTFNAELIGVAPTLLAQGEEDILLESSSFRSRFRKFRVNTPAKKTFFRTVFDKVFYAVLPLMKSLSKDISQDFKS